MSKTINKKNDLYALLVCGLLHPLVTCDKCKKCGKDGIEARMNLVRELAKYMDKELPWKEDKTVAVTFDEFDRAMRRD